MMEILKTRAVGDPWGTELRTPGLDNVLLLSVLEIIEVILSKLLI